MSRAERIRHAAALMVVLGACGSAPVMAAAEEVPGEKLQEVKRALEEGRSRQEDLARRATALTREVNVLRKNLIDAAAAAQRQEDAVTEIEIRLRELTREQKAKSAELGQQRAELAATLGALQRLGRQPVEVLITSPTSAVDAVRSSLLLSAVVPALEARAVKLRGDLAALDRLGQRVSVRRSELAGANQVLVKERQELDRLLNRKSSLRHRTEAEQAREAKRLAQLAVEADSLRALIAKLEEDRRAREAEQAERNSAALTVVEPRPLAPGELPPSARRSFASARGTLPLPARGRIVRRFGQTTQFGTPAKGITIETRPLAQVIAPHDGRIAFAGTYRGYGQLLIIEHGEGYHTLLAGLSRIDGTAGQWFLAGEPIGQMGEGSGGKPTLYIELRRNGEAINPLPWLAASERRASG